MEENNEQKNTGAPMRSLFYFLYLVFLAQDGSDRDTGGSSNLSGFREVVCRAGLSGDQ